MGETTGISWCHHTFNAWEGCAKVSPGCKHCYAETRNGRFHGGAHWGAEAPRLMRSESYWREPLKWARAARAAGERRRVFCSSLADVFEDRADVAESRARLFSLIEATPELDWLLLTKRPENMTRLTPASWTDGWPSHVWAGTTVENNAVLRARVPHLLKVPARVRFLSCEPLLESLDLDPPYCEACEAFIDDPFDNDGTLFCPEHESELSYSAVLDACADESQRGINWVIVGGESGPKARPCAQEWIESVVRQCRESSVPVFVKQLGAFSVSELRTAPASCFSERPGDDLRAPHQEGMDPDGEFWAWRAGTKHPAGADRSEWPKYLRVQEFPR